MNLDKVKDEFGYIRKQPLVNAERFITADLKAKEAELLHAKDNLYALEDQRFMELIDHFQ